MSTSPPGRSGPPDFDLGFSTGKQLPPRTGQVIDDAIQALATVRARIEGSMASGLVSAANGLGQLQQRIVSPLKPALNGKRRVVDNLQRRIVDSVTTGLGTVRSQVATLLPFAPAFVGGQGAGSSPPGGGPPAGGGTVWYVLDPGQQEPGTYPQAVCEPVEGTVGQPAPPGTIGPFDTSAAAQAYIDANYSAICGPQHGPPGGGQYVVCCAAPPLDSGYPSMYAAGDPNIPPWCVGNYAYAGSQAECQAWMDANPSCLGAAPTTPGTGPVQPPPPLPPPEPGLPQPPPIPAPGQPGGPPGGNGQCPPPTVTCPPPQVIVNVPPCPPCPPTRGVPPPPPPPPPTGQPPTPETPTPIGGIGSATLICPPDLPRLPLPGTDKWCDSMPAIVAELANIGDAVIQLAQQVLSGVGQVAELAGWVPVIGPLIKLAARADVWAVQQTLGFIQSCVNVAKCISPCPPDAYLSLVALRSLFTTLDKLRGGIDPGVWITTDVQVSMSHLTHLIDYVISYLCPTEIPGIGEAIDCYLRGQITLDKCRCWVWMRGGVWETWERVIAARRRQPEQIEILRLENRGILAEGEMDGRLRNLGYIDPHERALIEELRNELPGPSDLVRFAVRHVFEPSLVERFDFAAEMPQGFLDWHAKLGLGYPITITDSQTGKVQKLTWAQAHWEAHWVWPSPTQAYEMLFRFYPGRDTSKEPDISRNLTFTTDDLNYLLRGNDYPPHWRPYLAGIAYRLPGIRYMQDLVKYKVWGRPQLVQNLRQTGYSPQMSEDLADLMIQRIGAAGKTKRVAKLVSAVTRAYRMGILTEQQYRFQLQNQGLDPQEIAFTVSAENTEIEADATDRELKTIRKRRFTGEYSVDDVRAQLRKLTITPDRVQQYIDEWEFELEGRARSLSVGELKRDVVDGLVTLAEFANRMMKLGYNKHDIGIMTSEIGALIQAKLVSAIARADAKVRQGIRAAKQAAREAKVLHDQSVRALLAHGTPADLAKWYVDNLIERSQVVNRLRVAGWPDSDIDRLLDEALVKAKLATKPGVERGQPPPVPPEQGSPPPSPQGPSAP